MHLLSALLTISLSLLHLPFAKARWFPPQVDITPGEPPFTNCAGSSSCSGQAAWWEPIPTYLDVALDAVKPRGALIEGNNTMYYEGEHIMCRGHNANHEDWGTRGTTCMFLEGRHVPAWGVPMWYIIDRLAAIKEHGCLICGSAPLDMDDEDEISYGRLVVNMVHPGHVGCGIHTTCMSVTKDKKVRMEWSDQ